MTITAERPETHSAPPVPAPPEIVIVTNPWRWPLLAAGLTEIAVAVSTAAAVSMESDYATPLGAATVVGFALLSAVYLGHQGYHERPPESAFKQDAR